MGVILCNKKPHQMPENVWVIWDVESGSVRENQNQVTEQDIKRVHNDQKKAKQIQWDIKKDKDQNNKLAEFLAFLLRDIQNDKLISILYQTFFKTKDQSTDIEYLRKSINSIVIVGMFVPFYKTHIEQLWLANLFDKIYDFHSVIDLKNYIEYIKKLSSKYHDNIPVDKENFLRFFVAICMEYGLVNLTKKEELQEFKAKIEKELY